MAASTPHANPAPRLTRHEQAEVGEDQAIAAILQIIKDKLRQQFPGGQDPMRRDSHPKHHGVVRAELVVEPDLPPELAVGIFRAAQLSGLGALFQRVGSGSARPLARWSRPGDQADGRRRPQASERREAYPGLPVLQSRCVRRHGCGRPRSLVLALARAGASALGRRQSLPSHHLPHDLRFSASVQWRAVVEPTGDERF